VKVGGKLKLYVPPKRRFAFNGLHDDICQNINCSVRASDRTKRMSFLQENDGYC
jgi:hypothetical protein